MAVVVLFFNELRARAKLTSVLAAWLSIATAALMAENRTYDGTKNNVKNPDWGTSISQFTRIGRTDYADRASSLAGPDRPNPRTISSALFRQTETIPNDRGLSGYVYAFGQFISHDLQETINGKAEPINITVPPGDDMFPPGSQIPMTRSLFDATTGFHPLEPRQQINFASSFMDASQLYGTSEGIALVLRGGPTNPSAKLRTSSDINGDGQDLLPRDAFGPNVDAPFVSGDLRVNENVILSAMHTLFMREHNRLVDEISISNPNWTNDELFERARKIVGAEIQSITFNEFLPALLGSRAPSSIGEYDERVNPGIRNEFASVFLRIGHSMLPSDFKRTQNDGTPDPIGPLPLEMAFSNPSALSESRDMDLLLKGLSVEVQEETDLLLVDGMRFAALGAIDVQRGRDHGIPDYNALRASYGLERIASFADITSNTDIQAALETVYNDVDSIDAFVGALAEDHLPGASVGPLVASSFIEQFERIRDGDRFWFTHDPDFTIEQIVVLQETTLRDVIERNSGILNLDRDVFVAELPKVGSDFNNDGRANVSDIDLLVGEIVAGANNPVFDIFPDGVVDGSDVSQWLKQAATENGFLASYLIGDADLNGRVDASDLNNLGQNWLRHPNSWRLGDFTANGTVDVNDLNQLAQNWLASIPLAASPQSVPEASALSLLVRGLLVVLALRRCRQANSLGSLATGHYVRDVDPKTSQ